MNETTCKPIENLFESSEITHFTLAKDSTNVIKINDELKNEKTHHTAIFEELQKITAYLIESKCDFSVDKNGDILLHCSTSDC